MFSRIFLKSIKLRKGRILIAIMSVVMGAAMVAALVNLTLDMKNKLGTALRSYGANITVESSPKELIKDGQITSLTKISNLYGYAPFMVRVSKVNGQEVAVVGTDINKAVKIFPWWKITGNSSTDAKKVQVLAGVNAAKHLKLKVGQEVSAAYADPDKGIFKKQNFKVDGLIETGGTEDNQILLELPKAEELFLGDSIDTVQISALTDKVPVEKTAAEVAKLFPAAKTKIISQISNAEDKLLTRIQLLMLFVTVIVLLVSGISVMSTMTTTVMERRKEIGIMKSIGADNRKIAMIFNAEAGLIGLAGGILGFGLGIILAQVIGKNVFNTTITPNFWVVPITIALAVAVTLAASRGPVREAVAVDPIITLRGE